MSEITSIPKLLNSQLKSEKIQHSFSSVSFTHYTKQSATQQPDLQLFHLNQAANLLLVHFIFQVIVQSPASVQLLFLEQST